MRTQREICTDMGVKEWIIVAYVPAGEDWRQNVHCGLTGVLLLCLSQSIRTSGLILLEAILFGALLLYFPVSFGRLWSIILACLCAILTRVNWLELERWKGVRTQGKVDLQETPERWKRIDCQWYGGQKEIWKRKCLCDWEEKQRGVTRRSSLRSLVESSAFEAFYLLRSASHRNQPRENTRTDKCHVYLHFKSTKTFKAYIYLTQITHINHY